MRRKENGLRLRAAALAMACLCVFGALGLGVTAMAEESVGTAAAYEVDAGEAKMLLTEDGAMFEVGKILRYEGMDHAETNEPTNRGYDPINISMTLRFSGVDSVAEAMSALQGAKFERAKYGGIFETLSMSVSGNGLQISRGQGYPMMRVSVFSEDGGIRLELTSLAPGAIRITLEGKEYLIVTPGDVNLDGEMNANDWGTVMRVLGEAPGEYDVQDYPGVAINGSAYDLWALLADMTSTKINYGNYGRHFLVDANDWGTIMYLLGEGWK